MLFLFTEMQIIQAKIWTFDLEELLYARNLSFKVRSLALYVCVQRKHLKLKLNLPLTFKVTVCQQINSSFLLLKCQIF